MAARLPRRLRVAYLIRRLNTGRVTSRRVPSGSRCSQLSDRGAHEFSQSEGSRTLDGGDPRLHPPDHRRRPGRRPAGPAGAGGVTAVAARRRVRPRRPGPPPCPISISPTPTPAPTPIPNRQPGRHRGASEATPRTIPPREAGAGDPARPPVTEPAPAPASSGAAAPRGAEPSRNRISSPARPMPRRPGPSRSSHDGADSHPRTLEDLVRRCCGRCSRPGPRRKPAAPGRAPGPAGDRADRPQRPIRTLRIATVLALAPGALGADHRRPMQAP